jgi:siroheme synthase-like protein
MMGDEPALLPFFLKMKGRRCLLVGAGKVALEKLSVLLESGASIHAVAPDARQEIVELARDRKITWSQKPYSLEDLEGFPLVVAATNNPDLNHRVYADAVAAGRLVNVVDDPEYCDFYFGSIVRRGKLQVAISTAGESPAFAQQLKKEIDQALPADTGEWLERLGDLRRHVNRVVDPGPQRITLLRELAKRETCEPATCPCRSLT